ncbi:MAG: twin-arginine translocation signal domain-containing protein, partial [Pannonibacter indicus]
MSTTEQNMSRRDFLKSTTAAAGLAALSTMIVFRANAAAGPGELLMSPATPNPQGAFERLFLLKGDPLAGPVRAIVTEAGN